MTRERQSAMPPPDALARLKAGNERFVSGNITNCDLMRQAQLEDRRRYARYRGWKGELAGLTKSSLWQIERQPDRGNAAVRPPLSGEAKSQVTLRIGADVLASYRESGDGWQGEPTPI